MIKPSALVDHGRIKLGERIIKYFVKTERETLFKLEVSDERSPVRLLQLIRNNHEHQNENNQSARNFLDWYDENGEFNENKFIQYWLNWFTTFFYFPLDKILTI